MLLAAFPSYDCDDQLLDEARDLGQSRLKVYRASEVAVVLGRGSDADREVDLRACRADGVAVWRRRGGGCSVVLDPGNVIVSCAVPVVGIGGSSRYLCALSAWLIAGLERLGAQGIRRQGISDLAQGERKVSGSCLYRPRGLLYYSATLLVEADLEAMARYLLYPPREPDYRQARGHRDFVANLSLPAALGSAAALESALSQTLRPPTLLPEHHVLPRP